MEENQTQTGEEMERMDFTQEEINVLRGVLERETKDGKGEAGKPAEEKDPVKEKFDSKVKEIMATVGR